MMIIVDDMMMMIIIKYYVLPTNVSYSSVDKSTHHCSLIAVHIHFLQLLHSYCTHYACFHRCINHIVGNKSYRKIFTSSK